MDILSQVSIDNRGLVLISDIIRAAINMMRIVVDIAPAAESELNAGGVKFFGRT